MALLSREFHNDVRLYTEGFVEKVKQKEREDSCALTCSIRVSHVTEGIDGSLEHTLDKGGCNAFV